MSTSVLVCAPTPFEARPLRGVLPNTSVRCTGPGPIASRRAGRSAALRGAAGLAVVGIGAGVQSGLETGDVVVATEVRGPRGEVVACPVAALLAATLRRAGLSVHTGPVASVNGLVGPRTRHRLAATGVLCADMESAWLLEGARTSAPAVLRVVADPADRPLLRLDTWRRIRQAVGVLPRLGDSLDAFAAATGPRRILLAAPRSFCAGVVRAIDVVERALEQRGAPVYVRRQIVHNTHVVGDLQARGAVFVDELDQVPRGASVVFSAHGVSPVVRAQARSMDLDVIDATCPLVTKVHTELRRFADSGDTVLFIGHRGHEETEGTMGERPAHSVLVEDESQAASVQVLDPDHVSYLVQTTLAAEEVQAVVDVLRRRFPRLRAPASEDICYATTNRQQALREIALESELVLVVGSTTSSNSTRLVELAERLGRPAHLVDDVRDVDLRWLAGVSTVGITAGASAPPAAVDDLLRALHGLGPVEVLERRVTTENVHFTVPKEVRTR